MPNEFFRDLSPDQQFFIQNWLKSFDNTRMMNYLRGFQLNPSDPNYNYALAMASGVSPRPQMEDQGWPHWSSKTPEGNWLKEETHPTHHYEDEYVLRSALNRALMGER
jgi:hypothetical protein